GALEPVSRIEPITGGLARRPRQSVPRRTLDTPMKPVRLGDDASQPREMRTNVSWAGEPTPKGVGRVWIAAALVVILAAGGTTAYLKRALIAARFGSPAVTATQPATANADPAAFPPAPPIPVVVPAPSETTSPTPIVVASA